MGLDWNPIGRPKPGHEEEFVQLFKVLGDNPANVGFIEKIRRRFKGFDRDKISAI